MAVGVGLWDGAAGQVPGACSGAHRDTARRIGNAARADRVLQRRLPPRRSEAQPRERLGRRVAGGGARDRQHDAVHDRCRLRPPRQQDARTSRRCRRRARSTGSSPVTSSSGRGSTTPRASYGSRRHCKGRFIGNLQPYTRVRPAAVGHDALRPDPPAPLAELQPQPVLRRRATRSRRHYATRGRSS